MGSLMKNELTLSLLLLSFGLAQTKDKQAISQPKDNLTEEVKDGPGSVTFPNGDTYIGDCKNGLFKGQGEYHVAGGERYEGEWKEGEKKGEGTYVNHFGNT